MIEPLPKSCEPTHTSHVVVLGQELYIGFDREPVHDRLNSPMYYEAVSVFLGGNWYALADVYTKEVCDEIQREFEGAPA